MTDQPKRRKQMFADNFYNPITYGGVVLSLIVLFCETLLFWIDFFAPSHSDYIGIVTYILLPPFLILGLILIPLGASWKKNRVRKGLEDSKPKAIYIDLSLRQHQNAFLIFIIGTILVMLMTAIGSYKAFHYTESDRFCGATCHQIMQPEYQSHMQSPHARVKCVECHIGSGAGWYVHYKMAGVRMLFKTIQNSYATPIPAPVETLRPAKEICEQCHWPGRSIRSIQLSKTYYADDPSQTPPWTVKMLMRTGVGQNGESGIHAHMYYDDDIYYVADDAKRQKISWVKTVNKKGEVKIYTSGDSPYKENAPDEKKIRKMDCMDCHNRPAHHFEDPENLINAALEQGEISAEIPMIKSKAVDVLSKEYPSLKEATEKIQNTLKDYYTKKQAAYYAEHQAVVDVAIAKTTTIYQKHFYPEMKSRWAAYPDNIGHMISSGCFRCHDDDHKAKTGEVISRDCKSCHIITQQGSGATMEKDTDGLEFKHPFDGDDSWKTTNCSDCHTGGG